MRTPSHAFAALLLLTAGCACPPPAATETPGGGTPSDIDPGTKPTPVEPEPGAGGGDRTLAVAASDPLHARVEGTSFQNACQSDGQCFVGGCSSEICTAEEGVSGTCEMPAAGFPSKGASCGCVAGQCVWYRAGAGSGTTSPGTGTTSPGTGTTSPGTGTTSPGTGTTSPGTGTTSPGTGTTPGSGSTTTPGSGTKPGPGSGSGAALPKQGDNCTDDYKCAAGLTCKRYRGIAGARGPEFKTCEIPCTGAGKGCPAGQTCVTIADGPGQVCKPK
jgi:eight-cysteine-cluster-containing protein